MTSQQIEHLLGFGRNASYNASAKDHYKALSTKLLREVAKILGCYGPGIVRFNPGGIAICGDATLHSDTVYVQLSWGSFQGLGVLVRSVKSKTDYTGGPNRYFPFSKLLETGAQGLAQFAREVSHVHNWTLEANDTLSCECGARKGL